jgi:hypothetical protein
VREEIGGSPEWQKEIVTEAGEALEKIRRKEGTSIRHKLSRRGKEICKIVEWVSEEAEMARVEIRYGGRTITKEIRKHDRKALRELIKTETGLEDFWIRREQGQTMSEGIWKEKQTLFISPRMKGGMKGAREGGREREAQVRWKREIHAIRYRSENQFWEEIQRKIVDLWKRGPRKRPIMLVSTEGRLTPPMEAERETVYELGRKTGGMVDRIEQRGAIDTRDGHRTYTTRVLWESYTFEIRYRSETQFWQAVRERVVNLTEEEDGTGGHFQDSLEDEKGRKIDLGRTMTNQIYRIRRTGTGTGSQGIRWVKLRRQNPEDGEIDTDLGKHPFQSACAERWGRGHWAPYTTGGCLRMEKELTDGAEYIVVRNGEMPPETRGGRHSRSKFSRYDEITLGEPIIAREPRREPEELATRAERPRELPEIREETLENLESELRELREMKRALEERTQEKRDGRRRQRGISRNYVRCRLALGHEEVWVSLRKRDPNQIIRVAESIWGLRTFHGAETGIERGTAEQWRSRRIDLTAEETEESGREVTFRVRLHREEITVRAREGETTQNLEEILGSRYLKGGIRLINTSDKVGKNWQGTTRTAVIRIRGGNPEEEEEREEEEAEWESEEETRAKMEELEDEERDLREMARKQFELATAIRTMAARARAMISSYDERWRATVQMEILRQDIERLERDVPRLMEERDEHLEAAIRRGKRRTRTEEGLIPREVPVGYAKCQLRYEGEERWIMARPAREGELLETAKSIWGRRRMRIRTNLRGLTEEQWNRKIIGIEDLGPESGEEEAVFWGKLDRRVQKIKAYVGMPPEELEYVIRNRFQEPNATMGEQWTA